MKTLTEQNTHISVRETSQIMRFPFSTISDHSQEIWQGEETRCVPHECFGSVFDAESAKLEWSNS